MSDGRSAADVRAAGAPAAARGAKTPVRVVEGENSVAALTSRVGELEQQLAEALARVAALEAQRVTVSNRIDWAIDSLHTILES